MVIVFALVAVAVLAVVAALHWYVWRRLVRDTTRAGGTARRAGTAVFLAGPALMTAALVAERSGAPFWLQRTLAWPGFLWMPLALYLLLAVLAGEAVRPLLHRALRRRDRAGGDRVGEDSGEESPAPPRRSPVGPPLGPPGRVADGRPPETRGTKPPGTPTLAAEGRPTAPAAPAAPAGNPAPTRRLVVSRIVAGAAATAAVAAVGHGTYGVLRGPRVKRVTVPLTRLPRAAHGFRIAVVSDIHLGPILGRDFAQRVVDTVNATQPDLIAVVGDLVDGSVKDLGPAAAPLARLSARHGAYFVTGNHEYFSGAEQWVAQVRTLGLRPLENARTELPYFDLAGVNDLQGESEGRGPDFDKALAGRDAARACVLLAHQPVQIHEAVRHGVDLQLSGHTHGGQLWPGSIVAAAANPTVAGLDRYGDTQLYVTRGAGAWGPPTRVGAPSDVTVIELAATRA
ncbi:membrane protein [Streptomyces lucensis JCM 4490]|uniref:Membrane protein n=1 Tax=Streptomyces lucensis JCM 4490 TaxID=1306176 RepID=A0A918ISU1_9ACTN|nr:metallophosphoesterase [Streptomyces lucensis]GGW30561.1 membrane protein [Streptomyces lucensis JCM 4490]